MICKSISLGMLCLMNMIFFSPPSFDVKIGYDDCMPPIYDDYNDESGFGGVSTLGSIDPTILEGVESFHNIDKSGFGEVMALFNDDSTISEEISIDYDKLLSMMIMVMTCIL